MTILLADKTTPATGSTSVSMVFSASLFSGARRASRPYSASPITTFQCSSLRHRSAPAPSEQDDPALSRRWRTSTWVVVSRFSPPAAFLISLASGRAKSARSCRTVLAPAAKRAARRTETSVHPRTRANPVLTGASLSWDMASKLLQEPRGNGPPMPAMLRNAQALEAHDDWTGLRGQARPTERVESFTFQSPSMGERYAPPYPV